MESENKPFSILETAQHFQNRKKLMNGVPLCNRPRCDVVGSRSWRMGGSSFFGVGTPGSHINATCLFFFFFGGVAP